MWGVRSWEGSSAAGLARQSAGAAIRWRGCGKCIYVNESGGSELVANKFTKSKRRRRLASVKVKTFRNSHQI